MYTSLFFDLDHTLWDFERNSRETLCELYQEFGLQEILGIPVEAFIPLYEAENERLWKDHLEGKISREYLRVERFLSVFSRFDLTDRAIAEGASDFYLEKSPRKTHLFPNAIEVLDVLKNKYRMHIITNGFTKVQQTKISCCGLTPYFEKLITSEMAGANKPDPRIFSFALKETNSAASGSLMIGDTFQVDIQGAKNAGMDQAWFNPYGSLAETTPTYEVKDLSELLTIL